MVYLKYWTLNLMPLMVYPKVLFHPMFGIKGLTGLPLRLHRAAGLSDLATRHNSMKLETLQEMEYPLPVPLRSPPAGQQMGGTLQAPPRELTADQVKPLDMAKASLALRPQVIHRACLPC